MTETQWQPAAPVERALTAALEAADRPAFLIALAGADLFLLMPDEGERDGGPVWALSRVGDLPCLVAFTSLAALAAVMGEPAAYRRVRVSELAATWPDTEWRLAVDPGLPLQTLLDAEALAELSDVRSRPADALESRLLQAVEADDIEGYVAVLMEGDVLLPLDTEQSPSPSVDVSDPDFGWYRLPPQPLDEAVALPVDVGAAATAQDDDLTQDDDLGAGPIVAFTSDERLRDLLGDYPAVEVPFALMVQAWPDASDLLVDPGAAHGGAVAGAAMEYLCDYARRRADSSGPLS